MRDDRGESGGAGSAGDDRLAPVIPLFGRGPGRDRTAAAAGSSDPVRGASPHDEGDAEPAWRSTWDDDPSRPIPPAVRRLGGGSADDEPDLREGVEPREVADPAPAVDPGEIAELAEKTLLKKLRGRSLSVAEARDLLHREGVAGETADGIVEEFVARGYLGDAALAEQIVHVGLDRKGQGRRVIAQSLAKRGIPRDVADAALLALPDDDRERALEYARSKARALSSVDPDAALRRLVGQLARRGYGGSLALDVAREALREAGGARRFGGGSGASSGVRFVED